MNSSQISVKMGPFQPDSEHDSGVSVQNSRKVHLKLSQWHG